MNETEIKTKLKRYRPIGPSQELRERIFTPAPRQTRRPYGTFLWQSTLAALLLLSLGLNMAANHMLHQTNELLKIGKIEWTPQAEEAAQLLDGNGWGRKYIVCALAMDDLKKRSSQTFGQFNTMGGIQ